VAVELRGGAKPDTLVVPRAALHRGQDGGAIVYVAGADDRLERRPVEIGFSQADFVTIKAGLSVGERVVLSDPVPAIEGMLLLPSSDDDALARLLAQATGTAAIEMTGAAK
jgi:multidrug efflux pump subunit AcrA (membrane-fusion protein)